MGRRTRRLGTAMIVIGLLVVAYASAVLFWRDPVTDLYARYQQHKLAGELAEAWPSYGTGRLPDAFEGDRAAAVQEQIAEAARRFRSRLEESRPMGRIVIPRIEVDDVFVHGTSWGRDLSKGPGHYERTSVPGLGQTTAIAGHRTTFGAPFRKIDRLERGDEIVLELPYGAFRYRIFAHEIVKSNDWSIIRRRRFDTLVLSACHPLYSASHRWIVYARLAEVAPETGAPVVLAAASSND